jgi:hypothetical protein
MGVATFTRTRARAKAVKADWLISDALRFGALWYAGSNAISNAIGFAKHHVAHMML